MTIKKVILIFIVSLIFVMVFKINNKELNQISDFDYNNEIEYEKLWNIQVNQDIRTTTIYNNELYVLLENNNILKYDENGYLLEKIVLDNVFDYDYSYELYVFERYIVLYLEDTVYLIDRSNPKHAREIKVARNSFGLSMYENLLFYTDSNSSKVIALNVINGEIAWELYDGDFRRFQIYDNEELLIAQDFNSNEAFLIDMVTFDVVVKTEIKMIKKVTDGESSFILWDLVGINNQEILDKFSQRISSPLQRLENGFYSIQDELITIYDDSYKVASQTTYPINTYYNIVYNNNIVFNSRSNPVTVFNPKSQKIVWTGIHISQWSIVNKWGDALLIHYKDGYIEKLKEKQ